MVAGDPLRLALVLFQAVTVSARGRQRRRTPRSTAFRFIRDLRSPTRATRPRSTPSAGEYAGIEAAGRALTCRVRVLPGDAASSRFFCSSSTACAATAWLGQSGQDFHARDCAGRPELAPRDDAGLNAARWLPFDLVQGCGCTVRAAAAARPERAALLDAAGYRRVMGVDHIMRDRRRRVRGCGARPRRAADGM